MLDKVAGPILQAMLKDAKSQKETNVDVWEKVKEDVKATAARNAASSEVARLEYEAIERTRRATEKLREQKKKE